MRLWGGEMDIIDTAMVGWPMGKKNAAYTEEVTVSLTRGQLELLDRMAEDLGVGRPEALKLLVPTMRKMKEKMRRENPELLKIFMLKERNRIN